MDASATAFRRLGGYLATHALWRLVILSAVAALELDWATKTWAMHALEGARPLGALVLAVEHNTAFAFSTGEGAIAPALVMLVRLAALGTLVVMAVMLGLSDRRQAAGVGLVLGGGLGNAGDLVFRTHGVVDFIGAGPFSFNLGGWESSFGLVFNLADLSVLIGIALLSPLISTWAVAIQARIARWEQRWLTEETEA